MANDEFHPSRFDPLKAGPVLGVLGWWAILTDYGSPLRTHDRPATRDWRDEHLARAAYLSIVGIERLVRAVASLIRRAGRYGMQQIRRTEMPQ